MAEPPEVTLLDEVAHSLMLFGVIVASGNGLFNLFQLRNELQTSAEIAAAGLVVWGIGVMIMHDRYNQAYPNLTPS